MALTTIVNGATTDQGDLNQYKNLLTGVMTDQAVSVANKIGAAGMTNATSPLLLVGSNSSGAPTAGTWATGDIAGDQTGLLWMCTTAGTPGTWTKLSIPNYSAISTVTPSVATTVTFSSIPSTYTHLFMTWTGLSVGASSSTLSITLNGDTTASYQYQGIYNNGTSQTTYSGSLATSFPSVNAYLNTLKGGSGWLNIHNYKDTSNYKSVDLAQWQYGYGSDYLDGGWLKVAAVTSITLTATQNFAATGSITLFGVG